MEGRNLKMPLHNSYPIVIQTLIQECFADGVNVTNSHTLKEEDYPAFTGVPNAITQTLRSRRKRHKGMSEKFLTLERLHAPSLVEKESHKPRNTGSSKKPSDPWLTTSKKVGSSVLQLQGTDSTNNMKKQRDRFILRAFRKGRSPVATLILSRYYLEQRPS